MTIDRRYQVFVSSTYTDLIEERRAVSQAILTLNHFPAGMELFPAANEDQWTIIKSAIEQSDYYILVIGGRYGSTSQVGLSYTEQEFDYAEEIGKPILAFVHDAPEEIPSGKTDQNDAARLALEKFRAKVSKNRMVKHWKSAE